MNAREKSVRKQYRRKLAKETTAKRIGEFLGERLPELYPEFKEAYQEAFVLTRSKQKAQVSANSKFAERLAKFMDIPETREHATWQICFDYLTALDSRHAKIPGIAAQRLMLNAIRFLQANAAGTHMSEKTERQIGSLKISMKEIGEFSLDSIEMEKPSAELLVESAAWFARKELGEKNFALLIEAEREARKE